MSVWLGATRSKSIICLVQVYTHISYHECYRHHHHLLGAHHLSKASGMMATLYWNQQIEKSCSYYIYLTTFSHYYKKLNTLTSNSDTTKDPIVASPHWPKVSKFQPYHSWWFTKPLIVYHNYSEMLKKDILEDIYILDFRKLIPGSTPVYGLWI